MPELIPSKVIDDVVLVRPDVHGDERGRFVETYRRSWFPDRPEMIQGNRSEKQAGAVVGLHFHLHQADYWYALRGQVRVVLHDLRVGSRTDGATEVIDLDGDVDQGVYIPPGVAHGFASLSDVLLTYLVDNYYDDSDEHGLAWDDPAVGADWGVTDPILSKRDQSNPGRDDIPDEIRPRLSLPAEAASAARLRPRRASVGASRCSGVRRRRPGVAGDRVAVYQAPLILLNRGRC